MTTLAAFLGTNNYLPVFYSLSDERQTQAPHKYTQVALVELLPEKPDKVCLFVTDEARSKNLGELGGDLLLEQLRAVGFSQSEGNLDVVAIPPGSLPDELWSVFETLRTSLSGEIIFDCTHGFRSLPVVTMPALQFLQSLSEISIVGLYYGAFEVLGTTHDVRKAIETGGASPTAPIFDLTAMLDLPLWTQAVAEWTRTGRAEGLELLLHGPTERLGRSLGKSKLKNVPHELRNLPARLGELSDALAIVHAAQVERTARALHETLNAVESQIREHNVPELRPFVPIIERLQRSIRELVMPTVPTKTARDSANFLVNLSRWYLGRMRFPEAATCAREAATDIFVALAVDLGITTIMRNGSAYDWRTSVFRTAIDGLFIRHAIQTKNAHDEQEKPGLPQDSSFSDPARRIDDLVGHAPSLQEALVAINTLREHRNKPMHAYTGDHTKVKLSRDRETRQIQTHADLVSDIEAVARLCRLAEPGALAPV